MRNDIRDRLPELLRSASFPKHSGIRFIAADEIEALRAEVAELKQLLGVQRENSNIILNAYLTASDE